MLQLLSNLHENYVKVAESYETFTARNLVLELVLLLLQKKKILESLISLMRNI